MDEFKTNEAMAPELGLATVNSETNLAFQGFNFLDTKTVKEAFGIAKMLSQSDLVPATYKNKPANVLIAMQMADKTKLDILTVMSSLYIVQGRPSWSGQYCIMAVNGCGRFEPLKFQWFHEDAKNPERVTGCVAYAKEKNSDSVCYGTKVDDEMVKGFGWDSKAGSMWLKGGMRNQMFMYRCAAFFARTYCPEVLCGLYTADENRDIAGKYDDVIEEPKVSFKKGV